MVARKSHKSASCPVARPLDAIGDWWALLIVRDAFDGLSRFGEFQKSLGLSKNILSGRLRNLVAHGILETEQAAEGSAYQRYVLTEKGRALFPLLVALRQWGEDYCFALGEGHVALVDKQDRLPIARLEVHAHDGRLVRPDETEVVRSAEERED
jgi:DNA-binding HxlR family transcriptional regulator